MYQRIITMTRMFRERWILGSHIVLTLEDGIFTADAAVDPTLGGVRGKDAIFDFCTLAGCN